MCLAWGEGHGSSIHDHSDSHCFVKILRGDLQETMYDWPENKDEETEMHKREVMVYPKDGVTYINGKELLSCHRNTIHFVV
jgi:cysteine dioxygenase